MSAGLCAAAFCDGRDTCHLAYLEVRNQAELPGSLRSLRMASQRPLAALLAVARQHGGRARPDRGVTSRLTCRPGTPRRCSHPNPVCWLIWTSPGSAGHWAWCSVAHWEIRPRRGRPGPAMRSAWRRSRRPPCPAGWVARPPRRCHLTQGSPFRRPHLVRQPRLSRAADVLPGVR